MWNNGNWSLIALSLKGKILLDFSPITSLIYTYHFGFTYFASSLRPTKHL
jgi:hypothetical protein